MRFMHASIVGTTGAVGASKKVRKQTGRLLSDWSLMAAAPAPVLGGLIGAGVEGMAAGAGRDRIWVADGETAAHEGVHEIDFGAREVHGAEVVDEDAHAFGLDDFIAVLGALFNRHAVLETGAAARRHEDAQRVVGSALIGKKRLELGHGFRRDRDHLLGCNGHYGSPSGGS